MNAISLKHISKRYGETTVFEDFSLDFPLGSTTSVMGPSGCGKTTLMRLILGLEAPDAGSMEIKPGLTFACVFQEDRLIRHYTALKNLRLTMPERNDGEALSLLKELGLEADARKRVSRLSGGMARRVAIARALLSRADVIILDEPLKGLDEKTKENTIDVIKRRTRGKTLLLITHDVTEAQSFGGEIAKLKLS